MAKKRKPMAPDFDPDKAALMLADAAIFGDIKSAKRYDVSTRTLQRYRARSASDPALARAVAFEKSRMLEGWRDEVIATTVAAARRARELLGNETDLHQVTGTGKVFGELALTGDALGPTHGKQLGATGEGGAPPPPARADAASADGGTAAVH